MNMFRRKNIRLPRHAYIGRAWYFVTACTEGRREELKDHLLVRSNLALLADQASKDGFAVQAFCFMPDHLHLLLSGLREESDCLAFMKGFKQRSAFEFARRARRRLWQRGFYDHIVRSTDRWEAVAGYIWMNPVRRGLCQRAEEWPFSGSETLDWRKMVACPGETWIPLWKSAGLKASSMEGPVAPPFRAAGAGLKPGATATDAGLKASATAEMKRAGLKASATSREAAE